MICMLIFPQRNYLHGTWAPRTNYIKICKRPLEKSVAETISPSIVHIFLPIHFSIEAHTDGNILWIHFVCNIFIEHSDNRSFLYEIICMSHIYMYAYKQYVSTNLLNNTFAELHDVLVQDKYFYFSLRLWCTLCSTQGSRRYGARSPMLA